MSGDPGCDFERRGSALRSRRSNLAELSAVVERCLAKGPSGRYGSTEELALEVKRIANRAGGEA